MKWLHQHLRPLVTALSLATTLLVTGCLWDDSEGEEAATKSTLPDAVKTAFGADPNKLDTDGDGLTDDFEISHGYPFLKPDNIDTNANGVSDADEDSDQDKLTNKQEQQYNTHPLTADTDSDGLSDYAEIFTYKTDPLKPDTDSDGVSDGREVTNGTNPLIGDSTLTITSKKEFLVLNTSNGVIDRVNVEILGVGDLAGKASIKHRTSNTLPFEMGVGFDISLPPDLKGKMQSASITIPYDPTTAGAFNDTDFAILTIDPATGFYEPLTTVANSGSKTLTATTTHFSDFFGVIKSKYDAWLATLPKSCTPVDDPNAQIADVVLVIDSSGSMFDNDPQNLRRTAAKEFIKAMKPSDRTAVVDFDGASRVAISLSQNQSAIGAAIDTIDSSGSTNIGAGISSALNILTTSSDNTKLRAVFLLTDGDGSYNSTLTTQAASAGIKVFTVGLTGAVNDTLLSSIATGTGGAYKKIADANSLVGLFSEFSQVFGDTGKDSDGDGLTDCQETYGVYVTHLKRFVTSDPNNKQSDSDGVSDDLEVGKIQLVTIPFSTIKVVVGGGMSDPREADTDQDGLSDNEEYDEGTDPGFSDGDGDGIVDVTELEEGSDPNDINDPNEPDTQEKDAWRHLSEIGYFIGGVGEGLVLGEFGNVDTWAELAGATARNFIPTCGVLDGLDTIASSIKGDKVSVGLSFAGAASGAGQCVTVVASIFTAGTASPTAVAATGVDIATAVARQGKIVANFIKAVGYTQKNIRKVYRLLEKHNVAGITVHDVLAPALKEIDPAAFGALEKAGLNSEDIVKAMSGIRRGEIAVGLGKAGEDAVNKAFGFMDKGGFIVNGRNRIADGLDAAGKVMREVKNVKYQGLTRQIQDYIDYSQASGYRLELFVRSTTALSQPLIDAINANKIVLKIIP